jgi:hypothetical protein
MRRSIPAIGRWVKRPLVRLKGFEAAVNRSSSVLYGKDMLPAEASASELS